MPEVSIGVSACLTPSGHYLEVNFIFGYDAITGFTQRKKEVVAEFPLHNTVRAI